MRNFFFALSTLSFLFTCAQNNDVFDLKKYLQEKSEKEWKANQEKELLSHQDWRHLAPQLKEKTTLQAKLSHTLPNGNKIYLLPEDNMPCVVPDMSKGYIPIITTKKDYAIKIPNATVPYKIIPEEKKRLPDKEPL